MNKLAGIQEEIDKTKITVSIIKNRKKEQRK